MRHCLYIAFALLAVQGALLAQPTAPVPAATDEEHPNYPEIFYIHGAAGLGITGFSSDDIETTLNEEWDLNLSIASLSVDLALSVRAGYRNLVQAEYRIQKGYGQKLNFDQAGEKLEIEANLDSKEWLLKANPVFFLLPDPSYGIFLVYGQGKPEYTGDLGIRFKEGDKTIFGAEFTKMFRWYAASVSLEYHDLSFGSYADEDSRPREGTWEGSYWMIQGNFSTGFGE